MISQKDGELVENTMTYKLAAKNQLEDVSWIRPGQVGWEWWNDASPYGPDVNFVSGYNLETYNIISISQPTTESLILLWTKDGQPVPTILIPLTLR